MLIYDSQIAFMIPEESRKKYLQWVTLMKASCRLTSSNDEQAWNTHDDPIIIADRSYFSQKHWGAIAVFMSSIGAKDITESLRQEKNI